VRLATLFSGGEGVGCGARMAGVDHLWGIEWDDDVASAARVNGFNVHTADVCKVDPSDFEAPDILHASPPCPNFSTAKQGGQEQRADIERAEATMRFVHTLHPSYVTLENVWGYRRSQSFQCILEQLHSAGYGCNWWKLNAANYGVPQTRERLVLIARRDGQRPQRPPATHARPEKITPLFDSRQPWVGWIEAVADIVGTFPDSHFAPWQLERLPPDMRRAIERRAPISPFLVPGGNATSFSVRSAHEPARTINNAHRSGNIPRAYVRTGGTARIAQLTPRALARLQGFPDSYKLPQSKSTACRVLGNAVPPLLYAQLLRLCIIHCSFP